MTKHTLTPCLSRKTVVASLAVMAVLAYAVAAQAAYTVYNNWDFENQALGTYTKAEITADFNNAQNVVLYAPVDIVQDTINGASTKVMRITDPANGVWGVGWNASLGHDYDEIYISYDWKFSNEFNSTSGGKMPGPIGLPIDQEMGPNPPRSGYGFEAHLMYKRAGTIISYHYDRTHPEGTYPWAIGTYNYNPIYMSNGTWYNVTQRLVMNTFTNGVANGDGIKETWVDGRLIFRETDLKLMENEASDMKIDGIRVAHYYGGDATDYAPLTECYAYIDNLKAYIPTDDPITGHAVHSSTTVLQTPDAITDRRVYYDSLKTTTGTLANAEFGSTYSPCIDEAYLIDAGAGHTVSYQITGGHIGAGDYLLVYDGNQTDSPILNAIIGDDGTITGTLHSTGRYMFVRFSADKYTGSSGFTGTIAFSTVPEPGTLTLLATGAIGLIVFAWRNRKYSRES